MIFKNLVFLHNLSIYRQEIFSSIPQIKYQMILTKYKLTEITFKKNGFYNVIAM